MKKLLQKKEVSLKERKSASLLANFFIWTLGLIWILLFLGSALAFYEKVFSPAMALYFTPESGATTVSSFFQHCCETWYIVTTIGIGVLVARGAFRLVGVWKKQSESGKGTDAPSK